MKLPTFIETQRLVLRLPECADAEPLNKATNESFTELNQWMDWAAQPPKMSDTSAFCSQARRNWEADSEWPLLMIDKVTDAIVGATGYPSLDWKVPRFEIGYWCHSQKTGQGFVSEATAELVRFAFQDLNARRVELRIDARNQKSQAVADRLGFQLEATLRNHMRANGGGLRDTRVYTLLHLQDMIPPDQPFPHQPL